MVTTRKEIDSIGIIEVPKNSYWGAQTQRSLKYFNIPNEIMPFDIIKSILIIKKAAAKVNSELGLIKENIANAIIKSVDEMLEGDYSHEFPLTIWQTGSGTQTNMNVNEVLSNRASEILGGKRGINSLVHPNDDVNKSQSSNDVFPTAMHISAVCMLNEKLIPNLKILKNTLEKKSKSFIKIIKVGRTHLQDAIPLTLGQEISGWISMLKNNIKNIEHGMFDLYKLAIGGTAVGTGFNSHKEYSQKMISEIYKITNYPFIESKNKFESLSSCNAIVKSHSSIKNLSVSIIKISNDIRWLSSGPRCGLGEISIPNNEPGSSMMPGKVNPTQCESINMICYQVMGNDLSISMGGYSGEFELNVYKPMIIYNFIQSVKLLTYGIKNFNDYCVSGITPNLERIKYLLNRSMMLATSLINYIGYEKSAEIVKKAHLDNITLKEAALKLNYVDEKIFDQVVSPNKMVYDEEI